ncbi:MAG TPA: TMEM165/GDT1 family protein [Thermoplasmata archaeon]|jgi:putative Ca2+/H+ antiporter (TMEM165/GDT1 family)|nr:TMEM165/GDT1 family protein [Thermoplasmata archaeon]
MESLLAFGAALGLIAFLELGDKTQLATISLATRRPPMAVLGGAATGLTAATSIGAAIGGLMTAALTGWLSVIRIAGGFLFVALGLWTTFRALRGRRDEPETKPSHPGNRNAFVEAAGLLFLAEIGDKTQIAVIILAATYAAPISIFAGASLAETLIAVTSVMIGKGLARALASKSLELVGAGLFLIAGVWLVVDTLLAA